MISVLNKQKSLTYNYGKRSVHNVPPPPGPWALYRVEHGKCDFFFLFSFGFPGGSLAHKKVLPTRVRQLIKWTLNGVSQHVTFAPLNCITVTLAKHNLKLRILIKN